MSDLSLGLCQKHRPKRLIVHYVLCQNFCRGSCGFSWICVNIYDSYCNTFIILFQNKLGLIYIVMTHHFSTICDIKSSSTVQEQAFASIEKAIEIFKRVIDID